MQSPQGINGLTLGSKGSKLYRNGSNPCLAYFVTVHIDLLSWWRILVFPPPFTQNRTLSWELKQMGVSTYEKAKAIWNWKEQAWEGLNQNSQYVEHLLCSDPMLNKEHSSSSGSKELCHGLQQEQMQSLSESLRWRQPWLSIWLLPPQRHLQNAPMHVCCAFPCTPRPTCVHPAPAMRRILALKGETPLFSPDARQPASIWCLVNTVLPSSQQFRSASEPVQNPTAACCLWYTQCSCSEKWFGQHTFQLALIFKNMLHNTICCELELNFNSYYLYSVSASGILGSVENFKVWNEQLISE